MSQWNLDMIQSFRSTFNISDSEDESEYEYDYELENLPDTQSDIEKGVLDYKEESEQEFIEEYTTDSDMDPESAEYNTHSSIIFGSSGYDPDEEYEKNEFELSKEELHDIGLDSNFGSDKSKFNIIHVYFAFLNINQNMQQSNEDSPWVWLNRVVSKITQYIHCELIFFVQNTRTGEINRLVSSIHRSHQLRMTKKQYKSKQAKLWRFFHYDCPEDMKTKMFTYEISKNSTPFNKIGFLWNFIVPFNWLRINSNGEKVFCSEQISMNLKQADPQTHKDLVPYATHPNELLDYLLDEKNTLYPVRECFEPLENTPDPDFINLT